MRATQPCKGTTGLGMCGWLPQCGQQLIALPFLISRARGRLLPTPATALLAKNSTQRVKRFGERRMRKVAKEKLFEIWPLLARNSLVKVHQVEIFKTNMFLALL